MSERAGAGGTRRAAPGGAGVWLGAHLETLAQAIARLGRRPVETFLNALIVGIALALPVGLYVLLENAAGLAGRFPADPEVSVFMAVSAGRPAADEVRKRLDTRDDVAEIRFVPREDALKALARNADMSAGLAALESNPLPDAFVVRLRDAQAERLEALRDEARTWPGVEHVQVDSEWARRLAGALRVGRLIVTMLGILLSVALVAVTFNTVRTRILMQRDEIEVSRLIGATAGFIRRPFLYHGALHGLLGGLAGLAIVYGAGALLDQTVTEFARESALTLEPTRLAAGDAVALLAFTSALGWTGAWLSATRHLWFPPGA